MRKLSRILSGIILISAVLLLFTSCKYMKMDPPPDVDKAGGGGTDNSCWMATASNMLAGAGYGTGTDVQARADEIYSEMVSNYGIANGGWADVALSWWLSSANNTWSATNPYTIVTVYGNKTRVPWVNANGAQFIGNELRRCQFLGLSISWPTSGSSGSGGHAITAWGDNMGRGTLSTNPVSVMVTDSDRDTGGDVQTWDYDDYTNPNPGGSNNGNGWYFDYSTNHPFIKHIITLCPTDDPSDNELTQKVVGSYKIHQSVEDVAATDLHYRVRTDVDILSYKTTIDWTDKVSPTITEGTPRRSITVDWDLKEHAIEYCTWVTITTEFVLPRYNAIFYDDVHFTYPATYDPTIHELHKKPDLYWWLKTPVLIRADQIPNVTGGYVVASFDVINPVLSGNQQLVGEYRLIHQYSYDQDPEMHEFLLAGTEGYSVENLRFGHTYGYPSTMELWKFEDWMTVVEDTSYFLGEEPLNIQVDWEGKLPYPEGEVIPPEILKEIREQK
ncbi:MAG: hypothetical protein KAJ50_09530 [Bacteroidales bacterium]|nr:hypothetical protein [Bacteroidales bacterium]